MRLEGKVALISGGAGVSAPPPLGCSLARAPAL